jgi:peptidase M42 family hydrolase
MIDNERMQRTLLDLLAIPSPSGFTDEIVHYVGQRLNELDIPYDLTRRGTIRARLAGRDPGPARAIVNHLDTIGAMVRLIRDDGRLAVWPIGFWSSRFAEGARATLFSEGGAWRATLLPMVNWGVSRDRGVEAVPADWDHVELRLDAPVFSAEDVRALGIEVGDYIALDSNPEVIANGYIVGRSIDNKGGAAAVLETLRHLGESGAQPTRDTYVLFTITETIGSGTGAAILPEVSELVTVDFASVPSRQKSPVRRVTIAAGDAAGPYDYHLTAHLEDLARDKGIPHQRNVLEAFHSDAASALAAGHDVRTAVLAYAGDASHSIERTHIDSLHNVAQLLAAYVCSEPTFQRDIPLTSVDRFPRQLSSDKLPPPPQQVPSVGDLYRANHADDPSVGDEP